MGISRAEFERKFGAEFPLDAAVFTLHAPNGDPLIQFVLVLSISDLHEIATLERLYKLPAE